MFFDTQNETDKGANREVLPDGTYRVLVVGVPTRATKTGTGRYVAATLQVTAGPHEGRHIFQNFNIENVNEEAQRIGRAQLKQFLSALGVTEPLKTEDDLVRVAQDKLLTVELGQRKDKRDGSMQNVVKAYKNPSAQPAAAVGAKSSATLDDSKIPF